MALSAKAAARGRLVVQILAGLVSAYWLLYFMRRTFHNSTNWSKVIDKKADAKFLTDTDRWLACSATFILLTILGFVALILKRKRNSHVRVVNQKARLNVWTTPVILRSPFGMLTLADIVFMSVLLFVMFWSLFKRSLIKITEGDNAASPQGPSRSLRIDFVVALNFGRIGTISMTLLWIPVSRGSPILNLLGIPFERAVKYHTWLGLLTIWAILIHGIMFIGYFTATHKANVNGLFSWQTSTEEVAILAGFLGGITAFVMLVTAMQYVRRKNYDLFYVAHHLYLLFLLFFSFHVSETVDFMSIPILLFFLDRLFRAVQSRKTVDVLSAKVLNSGTIELTIAKSPRTTYHALSFIYVVLPSVSKIMWHPFSVASSPLDETNQIIIYIRPLGKFTRQLHDVLVSTKEYSAAGKKVFKCPFSFQVGVEGSYSSESMFYLRYQSLVLIAGGIGVTPFLAIIRDILHRYRLEYKDQPTSVDLIFCVRSADELRILETIGPSTILPGYEEHVRLTVHAYVTRDEKDSESITGNTKNHHIEMDQIHQSPEKNESRTKQDEGAVLYSDTQSNRAVREMSVVSSTGDTRWVLAVYAATIIGYTGIFGTFCQTVPAVTNSSVVRTMIYMVSMFIAVVFFGGGVMLIWSLVDKTARRKDTQVVGKASNGTYSTLAKNQDLENTGGVWEEPLWQDNIFYGKRPVWGDVFNDLAKRYAGQNIGVMVSGTSGLQQDVASQCRRHSLKSGSTVVFHYHSVSFDL